MKRTFFIFFVFVIFNIGIISASPKGITFPATKIPMEVRIALFIEDISLVNPWLQTIEGIWFPVLEIVNTRNSKNIEHQALTIKSDGTVNYLERFNAEIFTKMDFENFPLIHMILL